MLHAILENKPKTMLGKSLKIFLKDRASDKAAFYFYCNEAGSDYISGHDDESLNLRIDLEDIDFVMWVN